MEKEMFRLSINGYDKLGKDGEDGLRFAWTVDGFKPLLESAAFINKTRNIESDIAGYTTSVSLGCILKQMGVPCRFCRTGRYVPFSTPLTSTEIAVQNVFMVLCDLACEDHPGLKYKKREFAYMGQGEPGFSYTQLRQAIRITDRVMKKINQDVFRHLISTSGVSEFLDAYTEDINNNFFSSRTTIHFSLHHTINRRIIMPIEGLYPYKIMIPKLKRISELSGEKVCIGVLLFNRFRPLKNSEEITSDRLEFDSLIESIDPSHFRISLCEFNYLDDSDDIKKFDESVANEIYSDLKEKGFEVKRFFSYGKEKESACGMLAGKLPEKKASRKLQDIQVQAEQLVMEFCE